MTTMNKNSIKLILLISGIFFFFSPSSVLAQNDELMVEYWTGTEWRQWLSGEESFPIFKETNFLPGETVSRKVRVTNNSGQEQRIAAEAINVSDPDRLGDALILEIRKEDGSRLYNSTLSQFFNAGEVYLSGLAGNGGQTQYNFVVSFYSETNNDFQGKTLGFDILIGLQGTEGGSAPGGGGGGGGFLPPGLTITNETEEEIGDTFVKITWQTNYFSTSSVIYDDDKEQFDLSEGEPKYGYEWVKEGDDSGLEKVTAHSVTLTGLSPGTTYYFRCVSHGSFAVSTEHSFTTLVGIREEGSIQISEEIESGKEEIMPSEAPSGSEGRKREEESGQTSKGIEPGKKEEFGLLERPEFEEVETEEKTRELTWLLAAIGDLFKIENLWWILLIVVIIILILFLLSWKKRKKDEKGLTKLKKRV